MTTTPFLGCKISLISKSEIRYEGILYTIDPKESTIALSKVRSYGTEDRPAERQVPPRDDIFEYIIFRAGDIKDLIVDDPPSTIAPGLADPAIIQAHSTSTSSGATFPSTTFPQMSANSANISANSGHRPAAPAFSSGQSAINSLGLGFKSNASNDSRSQNSTPTGGGGGGQQRVRSPQHDSVPASAQSVGNKQTANKENQRLKNSYADKLTGGGSGGGSGGGGHSGGQQQREQYRRDGGERRGGGGGGGGGQPHHPQQAFQQNYAYAQNRRGSGGPPQGGGGHYRQNQNQNHLPHVIHQSSNRFADNRQYDNRRYDNNRQQFNSYGGGQRRPQMQGRGGGGQSRGQNRMGGQNRVPKEPLKFDKEFDFEKGFEEFSEMEKKLTNLKLDGNGSADGPAPDEDKAGSEGKADGSTNGDKEPNDDHFYDKAKSFFDTISCEALEREKGNVQRIDWKAERKLNSETFGVVGYRRIFGRGRGGYGYRNYGGGYRGYRGGGGFGRGGGGGFNSGGGDTRRYNNNKGPQQLQTPNNRNANQ